jgi:hypothetical protein
MTASGLRREARRGRLVVERIAGKDYTTLVNIERMRELCRVEAKDLASGSAGLNTTRQGKSLTPLSGLSKMGDTEKARDAASRIVEELRGHSPNTSHASISRKSKQAFAHPQQSQ